MLLLSVVIQVFLLSPFASAALPADEEIEILRMFYTEEDLVVTPTRHPTPISQIAENITVITSEEIEQMNAHTLTDVLNTVPGLQIDTKGGLWVASSAHIQGSDFEHILVVIDGVALNNLSSNYADIDSIPVQNIESIEIIKGPASSSWGSSLGGIINIITKSAKEDRKAGGMISASYGERNAGDSRFETSGKTDGIGYYLYAGNLVSDGFRPNSFFHENNLYTKFKWDLDEKSGIIFTFGYNKGSRGDEFKISDSGMDIGFSLSDRFEYLFSTLSLNYKITDMADLAISLRTSRQNTEQLLTIGIFDAKMSDVRTYDDSGIGASAKATWKTDRQHMVFGADFDHGELKSVSIEGGRQSLEKWAFFANNTIVVNNFTFTPGIRYDHTNTNGDFWSPSLGITYKLAEKTVLRGYIAKGFNIPGLSETFGSGSSYIPNPDLEMEKVLSYQVGMESTALKYIWLKTTLYRHDISDAIVTDVVDYEDEDSPWTVVNKEKLRRQGIEVELKTVPVYNTSLFAGGAYNDAKDRETGETLIEARVYTYDTGIQYNDKKSFSALLKGHYIWWNDEEVNNGSNSDFIWDLNLKKKVFSDNRRTAEVFLAAHNIFNGSQYLNDKYKNPGRWIEAGLRIKF